MNPDRTTILDMLHVWVSQRPGLNYADYGDALAYAAEARSIAKDLQHARTLLAYIERHDSISTERLIDAFKNSYSGRLSLQEDAEKPGRWILDYCTGQYWPTEYRRAACAVLSAAIWHWYLDECLPPETERKGAAISAWARREFGRGIGSRWFR